MVSVPFSLAKLSPGLLSKNHFLKNLQSRSISNLSPRYSRHESPVMLSLPPHDIPQRPGGLPGIESPPEYTPLQPGPYPPPGHEPEIPQPPGDLPGIESPPEYTPLHPGHEQEIPQQPGGLPGIESPPEYTPPPGHGPEFPQPPIPSTPQPEIPLQLPETETPAP